MMSGKQLDLHAVLLWLAVLLADTACFGGNQPRIRPSDTPPNILLIVSENNGPELGCYADPFARTPALDKLASEGLQFLRAYVPQAGCSQSRASLLTGLYPHQHGQIGLATWGFRMYRDDLPTMPQSLQAAG